MKIGYIRVSSLEQNEKRQEEALKKFEIEKFFIEKISAKNITERRELQALLEFMREGDVVYINDLSRIARSLSDLNTIIEKFKEKKVSLISLKENIDTATANGRLMLNLIGAINQFERENLLERQREGIYLAKLEGKYKGRKPVPLPENWETIYKAWKNREINGNQAMKTLKLKRNTFYKFIKLEKERENKKES